MRYNEIALRYVWIKKTTVLKLLRKSRDHIMARKEQRISEVISKAVIVTQRQTHQIIAERAETGSNLSDTSRSLSRETIHL